MPHLQTLTQDPATLRSGAGGHEHREEQRDTRSSLGRCVAVLLTGSNFRAAAKIQDVHRRSLSILVHQPLPEGSAVSIEFGAISREGEIISCCPKGHDYEACIAIPDEYEGDSRCAQRFPISEEVKIQKADLESTVDAVATDVSMHGIGLETSAPLEPGEVILIESKSDSVFGVVRHVNAVTEGSFRAGVEVFHVMPNDV